MDNWLNAIILGLIQGLTEFLPISSSGHLVLAEHYLPGWQSPGILFDALLHLGTLGSVFIYYHREWYDLIAGVFRRQQAALNYFALMIIASLPTALIGLLFQDFFESLFRKPLAVASFMLVTAGLLATAKFLWPRAHKNKISWRAALWIGTIQGIAIIPGISRSGSTISAGLLAKIHPKEVARFSFFLSVPAICGAILLQIINNGHTLPPLDVVIPGILAAFFAGWLAIGFFVRKLVEGHFLGFSIYLLIVCATVWLTHLL